MIKASTRLVYGGLLTGSLALLSSCAVYVPMQGAAPEIRAKGQLEVAASWSLTNRMEAAATYSPLPHLLVRAAASSKGSGGASADTSSYAKSNQYELGLGTYWPLGPHWLLGGLASFGQAHAKARYTEDGDTFIRFGPRISHDFDARYAKYAGETYLTWQPTGQLSLGLSYRLVQLRLTDVTDRGQPVAAGPILRGEPMLYVRLRPGARPELLQFQLALGGSRTLGYDQNSALDRDDPARQFKVGRSYVSLGVAFFPHVLWQRK